MEMLARLQAAMTACLRVRRRSSSSEGGHRGRQAEGMFRNEDKVHFLEGQGGVGGDEARIPCP